MKCTELPTDVVYAGREILGELALAESREILLTNGIGGYASLTLAGSLTRSYHGLLIAALRPPLDRTLLLSKLNDAVAYLGKMYHLSTDRRREHALQRQYSVKSAVSRINGVSDEKCGKGDLRKCNGGVNRGGESVWTGQAAGKTIADVRDGEVITPAGFEFLQSFRLEGTVPVFSYAFADAILEKKIWMKHGQNTVYVTYYLKRAVQAIELRVKALVNHRNHHMRTAAARPHFNYSANVERNGSGVSVLFTTANHHETALSMRMSRGRAELTNEWVTGFVLSEERARGLPDLDDNLHVATFLVDLPPGGQVTFAASAELNARHLSLDGDAELIMQHAYEKSLLQKFDIARDAALERRGDMEERDGSTAWTDSSTDFSSPKKCRGGRADVEPWIKQLVLAADQFIITRGGGRSVVAGFHWFTDWARDVSMPISC